MTDNDSPTPKELNDLVSEVDEMSKLEFSRLGYSVPGEPSPVTRFLVAHFRDATGNEWSKRFGLMPDFSTTEWFNAFPFEVEPESDFMLIANGKDDLIMINIEHLIGLETIYG